MRKNATTEPRLKYSSYRGTVGALSLKCLCGELQVCGNWFAAGSEVCGPAAEVPCGGWQVAAGSEVGVWPQRLEVCGPAAGGGVWPRGWHHSWCGSWWRCVAPRLVAPWLGWRVHARLVLRDLRRENLNWCHRPSESVNSERERGEEYEDLLG